MSRFAKMFRLSLALILALTLSHATVARSQGGTIAGWIALCAGEDVIAVAVDAQGAPVAPHLPCPDCIMAGAALVSAGPVLAAPLQLAGRISRHAQARIVVPFVGVEPAARGPPSFA